MLCCLCLCLYLRVESPRLTLNSIVASRSESRKPFYLSVRQAGDGSYRKFVSLWRGGLTMFWEGQAAAPKGQPDLPHLVTGICAALTQESRVKKEVHLLGRGLMIAPPSQFSNQPQRMVDGAVLLRLRSY